MNKNFSIKLISLFLRSIFWFRYRVRIKGLENLNPETLNKPGGVIFLPNHPAVFVDPTLVTLAAWKKYPIRPMIVDYFYEQPVVHQVMKMINALAIPNFDSSSNSLKRRQSEEVIQTVIKDLKEGDNFLVYPAGRTKSNCHEMIGGASAVQRIVQEAPEANIVLVRTKGLWGSSFSRALTGKTPSLFPTIFQNLKHILKNGIFFTPRRNVTIEFVPAPKDFPYQASRIDMNRWLEKWYNQPDGLSDQEGEYPGDSLSLVSYSLWKEDLAKPYDNSLSNETSINLEKIPEETKEKIYQEIARITQTNQEKLQPNLRLDRDLGMDSLDTADLSSFIQDNFGVKSISPLKMNTVAKAFAVADKQIDCSDDETDLPKVNFDKWKQPIQRERKKVAPGKTVPEVFLNNCSRMGNAPACGDERAGILHYKDLKLRVIVLAEYIRTLPGKYVGVLLPSSVAAYAVIMACLLAGKVPMLINWTMGRRHLQAVRQLSQVEVVLTSRVFIDKLENVDLTGVDDIMIMLEEVRNKFSLSDKLRAFFRSLKGTQGILKAFGVENIHEDDQAVLLFTSGTESLPKGVPLTHKNVLSNLRSAFNSIELYSNDVMFGILPPFHAFGFTISGLMGILSGIRIVYSPDPTDGKKLAEMVRDWDVTTMCGAPTFLKSMFRSGKRGYFDKLKLCVTGAEKAPPELFRLAKEMGAGDCLHEGYGITECSPVLTINMPGKTQAGVGEPLEGIELRIVNPETFETQGVMTRGLVLAKGPNIFSGYINPDVSSPFVTIDNEKWFKTGDLGYLDDENRLIISGRQKRFVKIGGEMVSLPSIEDALLQLAPKKGWPISEDGPTLAVCAKEDVDEKTRIFLFTIFDTNVEEVNAALRDAGFSSLVKVTTVFQLDNIPIMGSGKIFYRELESAYLK
jgi:acyl-CoA synthetase (AMP-forming)/AMP-acid ligase II/1-acyl-sn-glycerol-3-phosphate acyltransferase/acyl carrier protein